MNKIINILVLVSLFILSACDLSVEVYDELTADEYPENEGQSASMTRGAYNEQRHLLDDGGWWMYVQEVTSDVLVFPQRGTDWEDGGKWRVLHRHTWNSNSIPIQNMWPNIYAIITRCNQTIETIEAGPQSDENDITIAEMKVLRSQAYFWLIDNYGAVPYIESFYNAVKAPYRVKREQILDQLISVVEANLDLLKEAGSTDNSVVSKGMAWMLLGKLYLNAHIYRGESSPRVDDMTKVAEYMNLVIDAGYTFETDRLAPFSADNYSCKENIYTIMSDEDSDDGMRHSFRTLHTLHQATYDLPATPWNGCAIKPDFYQKLFAANDGFDDADDIDSGNDEIIDQRSRAFLRGQQFDIDGNKLSNNNGDLILTLNINGDVLDDKVDGGAETRFSGYRVAKYEIEIGAQTIMNNDFVVYRLADAYLMRAEATVRGGTGANASADDDLNQIRSIAGLPDATATIETLLDERGRELFMEGHRRSDLIRFDKFDERGWWLGAAESDPGEQRLVFPIPQDQLDANPNLSEEPVDL